MVCSKLLKEIDAKAWSQKKVSKVNEKDDSLKIILNFIDYVNSLDEFACSLWENRLFENILVPNEFIPFFLPSAVRLDALNRRTKDLLVRPETVSLDAKTYDEYVKACDIFRSRFKKDGYSDMTALSNIRQAVNLHDVMAKASFNGRVSSNDRPFIPVPLVDMSNLFEDRYFNDDESAIILDFIAEMRFI